MTAITSAPMHSPTAPPVPRSCLLALVESIAKRMVLLNDKVRSAAALLQQLPLPLSSCFCV
jgi:hypothetical protein